MNPLTLDALKQATPVEGAAVPAALDVQVTAVKEAATRGGKPYWDVDISDASGAESFKVWEDSPAAAFFAQLSAGAFIRMEGGFRRNQYGLAIDGLKARSLSDTERAGVLAEPPERRARLDADWKSVEASVANITDPRLRALCDLFLSEYGERFRRAAAAREYHHARRGGLLEHVAQILRAAEAMRSAYPNLNWDLLRAGVLFHDCGKLWENDYEPEGFTSPVTLRGELLGHIVIGIELVNKLWRQLDGAPEKYAAFHAAGAPPRERVREHLLHLVAAHHGQREFGAPVTPRTPEAWMLHHLDNIDAKLQMVAETYAHVPRVTPDLHDFRRPLEGRTAAPLPPWNAG